MAARRIQRDRARCFRRLPLGLALLLVLFAFDAALAAPEESGSQPQTATLPPGTIFNLRLETAVSTKSSHLHGQVTARVIREIPPRERVAIPLGAEVRGRIEKLIPSSSPTDRARVLVRFTSLVVPGRAPLPLVGHVQEVENARERVLDDGTLQGVLAGESPLGRIEDAVGKQGKDTGLQKVVEKNIGKSDTSIEYPAGTDLNFVLDQPLQVDAPFDSAVSSHLAEGNAAAAAQLLAGAPHRAASQDNAPGDPLNLVVIGNAAEIRKSFLDAGWTEAGQQSSKTVWETVRAVMAEKGYSSAPLSHLYLYGRVEDLAFEKMLNTFSKRHHLRLWRSPAAAPDGREVWLGAATHDTGLEVRPGVVSHAIDPDLDLERAKVGADLAASGGVAAETLLTRSDPLTSGLTATNAPWKTDGKLLAIELKSR